MALQQSNDDEVRQSIMDNGFRRPDGMTTEEWDRLFPLSWMDFELL
jgi:hypothetical protein